MKLCVFFPQHFQSAPGVWGGTAGKFPRLLFELVKIVFEKEKFAYLGVRSPSLDICC